MKPKYFACHCHGNRSYPVIPTCHGSVDVQQVLLSAQDGGALPNKSQRHRLLHAALLCEVGLQHVHFGLPISVEHLLRRQPVAGGERDGCRGIKRKKKMIVLIHLQLTDTRLILRLWAKGAKLYDNWLLCSFRGGQGSRCSLPQHPAPWDSSPGSYWESVSQFFNTCTGHSF